AARRQRQVPIIQRQHLSRSASHFLTVVDDDVFVALPAGVSEMQTIGTVDDRRHRARIQPARTCGYDGHLLRRKEAAPVWFEELVEHRTFDPIEGHDETAALVAGVAHMRTARTDGVYAAGFRRPGDLFFDLHFR